MKQPNIKRFFRSVKRRGIAGTLVNSLSHFIDYFFDRRRGTETFSWLELAELSIDGEQMKHAELYQPTHASSLRRLLRKLNIPKGKTLVDLGSGKGKVLLVASEFGFAEVRGVEISPILCEVARKNCATYKERKATDTRFVIIEADAYDYGMKDDEDVFYLFNPFDSYVLEQVIQNLRASLERSDRKIWIIYRNAVHRDVIEETLDKAKAREYTFLGQDFVVFEFEGWDSPLKSGEHGRGSQGV